MITNKYVQIILSVIFIAGFLFFVGCLIVWAIHLTQDIVS